MVDPTDFIPLAESSGVVVEIGDWVFKNVARQAKHWRENYDSDFEISINQSPIEFQLDSARYKEWIQHLQSIGLPGNAITVEITEGLLLDANAGVIEKLRILHEGGIRIALDDFGTGYSALSYLNKFKIDYLKIDQSFTRNISQSPSDMALSEAIIVMAHKLGLQVIAEGVETNQQRDLLAGVDCDYGQGFLFAKPMPVEEFNALLQLNGKA